MKTVIDVYGRTVTVDDTQRKLYDYCNREKRITYNAPLVEDGKVLSFWTDYEEYGTVDNIADRLEKWNNKVMVAYARSVNHDANRNDPDGSRWRAVVERVKANPEKYFTKSGDFRKRLTISPEDIVAMAQ